MQAGVGGVSFAIGYAIGTSGARVVASFLARLGRTRVRAMQRRRWMELWAASLLAVIFGAPRWLGWQNAQRGFMGMPSLGWRDAVLMGVMAPLAGATLVVAARLIGRGFGVTRRFVSGYVPVNMSAAAAAVLIAGTGVAIGLGLLLPALTVAIDAIHAPINAATTEGPAKPVSATVSGSPASIVPWETLGRMGREFVATATSVTALSRFHGSSDGFVDPVRVYVGVESAESLEARAALAVRELERAGGFARKVLVVWVPTGTGWMIPKAATSLEHLYRGDTAIVAIQYSFLPSLLAVFMDAGVANQAGVILYHAVHARWSELPPDRRPKLLLFGKSLGTAGIEAPFAGADAATSLANMVAGVDGALLTGAKESNRIHAQLTRTRDPGSPFWQPVFNGGRSVRFLSRDPRQPVLDTVWQAPRIVYLQHPADPVVFWAVRHLWRPPEWLSEPRGFDVPRAMHWFPLVSIVQAGADLLDQLGPPPGFGHDYATEYVKSWASVVPPDGWTEADTERLERFIDAIPGDDAEPW